MRYEENVYVLAINVGICVLFVLGLWWLSRRDRAANEADGNDRTPHV